MDNPYIYFTGIFATALLAGIGYVLKRIDAKIDILTTKVANMEPKVDVVWQQFLTIKKDIL